MVWSLAPARSQNGPTVAKPGTGSQQCGEENHRMAQVLPVRVRGSTGMGSGSCRRYGIVRRMIAAGLFATVLLVGFIVLDWWYFNRSESQAMRYGCPIGAMTWAVEPMSDVACSRRFGSASVVTISHGWALWFPDGGRILLKPDCRRFASRFRTAWPLKGSVEVQRGPDRTLVVCTKRMPWSSVVLTSLWFLLVGGGSISFLVSFALHDGWSTMGSLLLGVGVLALGLLVLAFGLVTVALAYRIENGRLMQVWEEWQRAMALSQPERS